MMKDRNVANARWQMRYIPIFFLVIVRWCEYNMDVGF